MWYWYVGGAIFLLVIIVFFIKALRTVPPSSNLDEKNENQSDSTDIYDPCPSHYTPCGIGCGY